MRILLWCILLLFVCIMATIRDWILWLFNIIKSLFFKTIKTLFEIILS